MRKNTGSPLDAREAATGLKGSPFVRLYDMDQALVDEALNLACDYNIAGADSLYVTLAHRLSIPLVTFDREQLKRPLAVVATIEP